jgi:hypothetical protein
MTCGPDIPDLDKVSPNFDRYSENSTDISTFVYEKIELNNQSFPHYIICYSHVEKALMSTFEKYGRKYIPCASWLHAHYGDDRGIISVLCHPPDHQVVEDFTRAHSKY